MYLTQPPHNAVRHRAGHPMTISGDRVGLRQERAR